MERKDYQIKDATILSVRYDGEENRVNITLDESFQTINKETDEDVETKSLTIDKLALSQQLQACKVKELKKVFLRSASDEVSFTAIKAVLLGATVTIDRLFKKKGELRENKKQGDRDSLYTSNLFKSVFVNVEPDMDDDQKEVIADEVERLKNAENESKTRKQENGTIKLPFSF